MKFLWFTGGAVFGLTTLSLALGSVPSIKGRVTDDTAIYQQLSEIRVPKHGKINFDSDIARLSSMEKGYQEKLPRLSKHPRIESPLKRIAQQKYRYSSNVRTKTARN